MICDRREIRAAGLGAAIVALYTLLTLATGLVDPDDFAALFSRYLAGSISLWLIVMAVALAYMLGRQRPASPTAAIVAWLRGRWRRDYLISLFWPPLLFALLMAAFNSFKQMVLPAAGFGLDPLLAGLDRALAFGQDPWRITHALFGSPDATWLIDKAYHGWFLPMSLGLILCAFLPASTYRLRTQYLLSYIMTWIGIGSVLAFLLPSAGPCFYMQFIGPAPEFQALMDRLATQQAALGSPISALTFQDRLLAQFGSDSLAIGAGISAMPSVHNGLAILFAFAGFSINRKLGWVMSFYALMIWIGSIHLGWHYALDGLVALPLISGIWWAAGRTADWLERPSPRPAPVPVAA
jgi:PAP2 superfamily